MSEHQERRTLTCPQLTLGATRARLTASIAERLRRLGGPAGRLARAGIVGLVPVLAGGGDLAAAEPTRSSYIADVQIDQSTIKKFADESDNFHLTWHPNGSLYGAYGDGWGLATDRVGVDSSGCSGGEAAGKCGVAPVPSIGRVRPSREGIWGLQPIADRRWTSKSLRGVPSG